MATITGTSGANTIRPSGNSTGVTGGLPTNGSDSISAGAGNDTIESGLGSDTIDGGTGTDLLIADYSSVAAAITFTLNSTAGAFSTFTGQGSMVTNVERFDITTGVGNDSITLGAGADTLNGGLGSNTLSGGAGDDVFYTNNAGPGQAGIDSIHGGAGVDIWYVDYSQLGPMTLTGTGTSFTLSNGTTASGIESARFTLAAGSTANLGLTDPNTDNVDFDGSGGTLNLDWSLATGNASVTPNYYSYAHDLSNTLLASLYAYGVSQSNITTGAGSDYVYATSGNDTISTGAGDDVIHAVGGLDSIDGGTGNDRLFLDFSTVAGPISFTLNATPGAVSTFLGQGTTVRNVEHFDINTGAGDDNLAFGDGDDQIQVGAGNNTIAGGGGNDLIITTGPTDLVDGGAGIDVWQVDRTGSGPETVTQTGSGSFTLSSGSTASNIEIVTLALSGGSTVTLGALPYYTNNNSGGTSGLYYSSVYFYGAGGTLNLDWSALAMDAVLSSSTSYVYDPAAGGYPAYPSTAMGSPSSTSPPAPATTASATPPATTP